MANPVVLRAADRYVTQDDCVVSRHCFSFGPHYDAANTGFGALAAVNDERLSPGAGFPDHPHAGIRVVTWVVEGSLKHEDSSGRSAVSGPGVVHVLRTGDGVRHTETNAGDSDCRFVQSWIASTDSGPPSFERLDLNSALSSGDVVPVLSLEHAGAALWAGRLTPGSTHELPSAEKAHVFVVRGSLTFGGVGLLGDGDSARLSGAREVRAITESEGAELLVWTLAR